MKIQALAAVLLVSLLCPNVKGNLIGTWFHDIEHKLQDVAGDVEGKVKSSVIEMVGNLKHMMEQMKILGEKVDTSLLNELNVLEAKLKTLISQTDAEAAKNLQECEQKIKLVIKEIKLKTLQQLQEYVKQLQALTVTLQGEIKTTVQDTLNQLNTIVTTLVADVKKGAELSIAELTKAQALLNKLSAIVVVKTNEAFKKLQAELKLLIDYAVQKILNQLNEYINQLQAYAENLEGQMKTYAQQELDQLKTIITKGAELSIADLTKAQAILKELSKQVVVTTDKATVKFQEELKPLINYIGQLITKLQSAQQ